MKALAALAMIVGFSLGLLALYFIYDDNRFQHGAVSADGVVTELVSDGDTSRARVAFTDGAGQDHEILSRVGTSPPAFAPGQRVTVFYDPANPQQGRIATLMERIGPALISGAVGAAFWLAGLFTFLSVSRQPVPRAAGRDGAGRKRG